MTRSQAPGAALLHPVTLAALGTLAVNDHVLKHVCPGWWTGKLSDFAGVVLLPVFVHALLELAAARLWKKPFDAATGDHCLAACVAVALLAFALPEVWGPAELVYRYGLGAARWPFHALAALLSGHALPHVIPVRATADVTDLLALPMGLVAFTVGRRRAIAKTSKSTRPPSSGSGEAFARTEAEPQARERRRRSEAKTRNRRARLPQEIAVAAAQASAVSHST